jgi:hypothetical protein
MRAMWLGRLALSVSAQARMKARRRANLHGGLAPSRHCSPDGYRLTDSSLASLHYDGAAADDALVVSNYDAASGDCALVEIHAVFAVTD